MDGRRVKKWDGEASTHERVVQFLRREYPNVIFRTDFAAGIKLPPWLAKRQKALQYRRGFPDIFIFQPAMVDGNLCSGLALELKASGVKLRTRNGWADDHFKEQYNMLAQLNSAGYAASFACGYDEACAVIRWYLDGSEDIDFEFYIPKLTLGSPVESEDVF